MGTITSEQYEQDNVASCGTGEWGRARMCTAVPLPLRPWQGLPGCWHPTVVGDGAAPSAHLLLLSWLAAELRFQAEALVPSQQLLLSPQWVQRSSRASGGFLVGPARKAAKTPFSGLWVRIIRWRPSLALAWKPDLATALGLKYLGAIVGLLGREVPGLYPETLVPGPGDADVVLQNAQATSERN